MKSQRNTTRRLFSLVLAASILPIGFAPSGYSRSRHLIPSLAAPHPRAAQDGGESWKPVNTGLGSLDVVALAIDPVNTATIYVGALGGGMFKSIDGGAHWSKVALSSRNTTALAINFVNRDIIHASADDGGVCLSTFPIFKSTDGGASWSNANSPADCGISMLVMDPTAPNTLYAGSEAEYLFTGGIILWKSTDGGATWNGWRTGNIGLASYGLTVNPANPQILYAPGDLYDNMSVTDSGLFKSTDGGANWSATGLTNTNIRAVAIDPLNPNTLYAGSIVNGAAQLPFRGMLKSTDGGANWLPINNGLTNISRIMAIVVDRDNPSLLYIGTSGGVFKSTDGGAHWSAFSDGLTNLDIRVLTLAPGHPNTLYAGTASGVFKINDNAPATNPIDDPQFFVRQHYLDFLNREPDDAGLAFWTNQMTGCGNPDLLICRINVSAAFFLSVEFQQTGYLVERIYKVAYGDLPGAPVPIRREEFLPDTQRISQGVRVGIGDWEQQLENNKNAFAAEFVARQRFIDRYQALDNAPFVDALNANTEGALSAPERDTLVNELDGGFTTRAQVLRAVAEDADFDAKEKSKAFVLMQYFGYLRRNPNEGPDTDFRGYNFWLTKLEEHGGNFVAAEMVKAFIESGEYRKRFGQ